MALFQIVFKPVSATGRPEETIIGSNGVAQATAIVGNCPAVPSGNYLAVMGTLLHNTVQPSTAQTTGLNKYLALIQAGSDTSTVETALTAL